MSLVFLLSGFNNRKLLAVAVLCERRDKEHEAKMPTVLWIPGSFIVRLTRIVCGCILVVWLLPFCARFASESLVQSSSSVSSAAIQGVAALLLTLYSVAVVSVASVFYFLFNFVLSLSMSSHF